MNPAGTLLKCTPLGGVLLKEAVHEFAGGVSADASLASVTSAQDSSRKPDRGLANEPPAARIVVPPAIVQPRLSVVRPPR